MGYDHVRTKPKIPLTYGVDSPLFKNTQKIENGSVVFENEHFGDSIVVKDLAFRMLVALIRMLVQTIATTPTVQKKIGDFKKKWSEGFSESARNSIPSRF